MNVGTLTVDVQVDLSKLKAQLESIRSALDPIKKGMTEFATATKAVNIAANTTADNIKRLSRGQNEAEGTTANLGRALREMTTQLLGNSVAAIAVGTALGNLATQAVSQLFLAVKNAVTQFGEFHNALVLINSTAASAAGSLELVDQVSIRSNSSFRELADRYTTLVQRLNAVGVSLEESNRLFRLQEEAITRLRSPTIASTLVRLIDDFGRLLVVLDNIFQVSRLLSVTFTFLGDLIGGIGRLFSPTDAVRAQREIIRTQNEVLNRERSLNELMSERTRLQAEVAANAANLARRSNMDAATVARQREDLAQINREIDRRRAAEPTIVEIEKRITEEAAHQVRIGGLLIHQQEVQNQLRRIELQLMQAGVNAEEAKRRAAALAGPIAAAQAAQEFQTIRQSLVTREQLEQEHFNRRILMLQTFGAARNDLSREINTLLEEEAKQHEARLTIIRSQAGQMQFTAMSAALTEASNLLQVFGTKSKAAAIAALAIQKGLAIAQIAINLPVMEARAITELGVVAGTPVAAAIRAWGIAQMAFIAATGIAQAAGIAGGSPTGGAGGSQNAGVPEDEGEMPSRLIIEGVDPAMIFTGQQLNDLIDAINEKAANGTVVIASKLL